MPPPFRKYGNTAVIFTLIVCGLNTLWQLRTLPKNPWQHLKESDWTDLKLFLVAMGLLWLQFVFLTWSKAMIPHVVSSMWADPMLADFEAALLGGSDAWRLLPAPNYWLSLLYSLWMPAISAVFAWQFFRPNRAVNTLALILTIGLVGTFGQYLLPSGGPIFYERLGFGDRFVGMPPNGPHMGYSDYLWKAHSGNYVSFATGISAFPSVHVATSAWVAFATRHWIGYLYLGAIFLGSIILGWHYGIDGVAATAGAYGCYRLAKALALPKQGHRSASDVGAGSLEEAQRVNRAA